MYPRRKEARQERKKERRMEGWKEGRSKGTKGRRCPVLLLCCVCAYVRCGCPAVQVQGIENAHTTDWGGTSKKKKAKKKKSQKKNERIHPSSRSSRNSRSSRSGRGPFFRISESTLTLFFMIHSFVRSFRSLLFFTSLSILLLPLLLLLLLPPVSTYLRQPRIHSLPLTHP